MSWLGHPLVWIGIGIAGYALYRRRRGSAFGAPPPRGGIVLPAGLLSRKTTTPAKHVEIEPDVSPPDKPEGDFPPSDSVPPPEEPPDWEPTEFEPAPSVAPECEIVPSATARLHAKSQKTIIDWNDPNFAVTHLCHAPLRAQYLPEQIATREPHRFCCIFCTDVGWKTGVCVDDKCVCANNVRER